MQKIEELKKQIRAIDLALLAGKKRQSPRTGFVHMFLNDDSVSDTIPVYENFCFALALFRQKTADSVLEGKALIERLLAFQVDDGNFPVYLHDFPRCWDFHLGAKIAPILIRVLHDFGTVLEIEYREKLEHSLKKIDQTVPSKLLPKSAQEWLLWLVSEQIHHQNGIYPIPYNSELQVFIGDSLPQEKGEPQPQSIEYVLAEKSGFNKRLLRDHPNQIYAALLFPFSSLKEQAAVVQPIAGGILWKGDSLHSLYYSKGMQEKDRILFSLPEEVDTGRNDLFEAAFYCDISPEVSICINDQKGLVFHFGDIISIQTPVLRIDLRFELLEGDGDFCGHISRSNRPNQIACRGAHKHDAFDWQIGLRTLRRSGPCTIAAFIREYPLSRLCTTL